MLLIHSQNANYCWTEEIPPMLNYWQPLPSSNWLHDPRKVSVCNRGSTFVSHIPTDYIFFSNSKSNNDQKSSNFLDFFIIENDSSGSIFSKSWHNYFWYWIFMEIRTAYQEKCTDYFRTFLDTYWCILVEFLSGTGNYVLNYLATQPKLPNFVIQALVTLFARITKLGWYDSDKDEYVFRNVVSDVSKFLQVSFLCQCEHLRAKMKVKVQRQ